jgi:TonB-linked SusC/RagA family outer membrane protein
MVELGAQSVTYTGEVIDNSDGTPLIGVNVYVKGTTTGTITDFDGLFSVNASPGDTLQFSYIGYVTQDILLGVDTELSIRMSEASELLDEVIVVGYGTQKSRDLTSAISVVNAEEIQNVPTNQPMQALQGRIAGVQITSNGTPGGGPTVRVRGLGSFPGTGNSSPLYVVDGMFFDNIDFINSSDIESISVLKDASAAAIYGVRAANGVVIVSTKSGKYNKAAEIEYNGYAGIQVAQNVLKMANAEQFTTLALESGSAPDVEYVMNAMQRYGRSRVNPNVPNVNTDWYDEIMRVAPMHNHSLSITGGSNNATYSVGGNFFAQEGILDMENNFERFNLRSKIDYQANDWLKIGGNMIFSNSTQLQPDQGAWFRAYFAVPIIPVLDLANGGTDAPTGIRRTPLSNAQDIGYRGTQNPLSNLLFSNDRFKNRNMIANFYAEFDIIQDKLKFKSAYNHHYINGNSRNIRLPFVVSGAFARLNATINRTNTSTSNQIWDNLLTYTDKFDSHNLQVMAGTAYRDESFEGLTARGEDFPTDNEQTWYIDQAENIPIESVRDFGVHEFGMSYFGRVAYNYDNKYYLYGTYRADGTNKYQQKWAYFPTVGLGWVISEESFFNIDAIDFLKLRGSWGELGNDNVPASDGANTTSIVNTAIDDIQTTGTVTSSTFSSLRWEVVEEFNFGLTGLMFDNKLSVDLDYYTRDTKNAVIPVEIPIIGGSVRRNVGVIRNSGLEAALNYTNSISEDFRYNVGLNVTTLSNEVVDLFGQTHIDSGTAEFRQRSIVGEPLLAFYGREVAGVYQNQAEVDADPIAVANNLEPGDFKYIDQNGDGVIDDVDDRVVLGSYLPSFSYGGNIGIGYKSFDFSMAIFGQTGNKILNRKRGEVIFTSDTNWDADFAVNRWHGDGTTNEYPSSKGVRKAWNQALSDYYVEDGSYFRIQNISIGYNIDGESVFGPGAPDVRVTFTAEKPVTLFNYNGFNPEVANGVDRQTYPVPAIYTAGINVKF